MRWDGIGHDPFIAPPKRFRDESITWAEDDFELGSPDTSDPNGLTNCVLRWWLNWSVDGAEDYNFIASVAVRRRCRIKSLLVTSTHTNRTQKSSSYNNGWCSSCGAAIVPPRARARPSPATLLLKFNWRPGVVVVVVVVKDGGTNEDMAYRFIRDHGSHWLCDSNARKRRRTECGNKCLYVPQLKGEHTQIIVGGMFWKAALWHSTCNGHDKLSCGEYYIISFRIFPWQIALSGRFR